MADNLLVSFEVVAPLLLLMLLGGFLLRVHVFDDDTVKKMNGAIFKVFLPALIFNNLYNSNLSDVKDIGAGVFAAAVLCGAYILSIVLVIFIEKDNKKRGVMAQGICRSNFVIFGVPLCQAICGDSILGKISVAIAIVIPVINVLAVVSLEVFRGEKGGFNIKKIAKGIVKNPLIISSALGLVFLIGGIKLPEIAEKTISDVAKIATPLALILLGASINFSTVRGNLRQLIITISGKLVIVPLLGISLAITLGMHGGDLALLIAALASPTAVSSYPMAIQMDGDGDLAAQIVAFGTVACIITVFLWVFALKQLGLI
ncbi:MAG: AEC family transporter [Clostridia bacterium]|nr:AEC family transporter [Clostridia bacterium]